MDFLELMSHCSTSSFLNSKKNLYAQIFFLETWNEFMIAKNNNYLYVEQSAVAIILLIPNLSALPKNTNRFKELKEQMIEATLKEVRERGLAHANIKLIISNNDSAKVSTPLTTANVQNWDAPVALLEYVLRNRLTVELKYENLMPPLENIFSETLDVVIKMEGENRVRLLDLMGVYLSQLSSITLFPLWSHTLHTLARRTRKDLLADLRALTPVITSLGGVEAVEETAHAIQDIGRWWP
jgi:hypothetical protein